MFYIAGRGRERLPEPALFSSTPACRSPLPSEYPCYRKTHSWLEYSVYEICGRNVVSLCSPTTYWLCLSLQDRHGEHIHYVPHLYALHWNTQVELVPLSRWNPLWKRLLASWSKFPWRMDLFPSRDEYCLHLWNIVAKHRFFRTSIISALVTLSGCCSIRRL